MIIIDVQLSNYRYLQEIRDPLHLQKAYRNLGYQIGDFPVSEQVAKEIISLPVHPHITDREIAKICSIIRKVHNE